MAEIKKYLDLGGLGTFKEGMDTSIDQKDAATLQGQKTMQILYRIIMILLVRQKPKFKNWLMDK